MAVDEHMVARVARLARLRLEDGAAPVLAAELDKLLGWVGQLQAVDTTGVEPMTAVTPETHGWREDVVTDGGIADDVLANAPDPAHGFFGVPKVIE